jgi:ABC-2 type transport system permease protein
VNHLGVLFRRELGSFFLSPIAYITMVFFLAVMGFGFWFYVNLQQSGFTAMEFVIKLHADNLFTWIALLVVAPVITMRTFSEEKKSGTLETLMTAPVGDWEVVLAKFLGALAFYLVMWLPTLAYPLLLNKFSTTTITLDVGALAAAHLGGLLVAAVHLAIGVLCSTLTANQIVAAIMAFAVTVMLFFIGFMPMVSNIEWVRRLTAVVSGVMHMRDFSRGILDSRSLVFYLSTLALVLFAAVRVVEARRWK